MKSSGYYSFRDYDGNDALKSNPVSMIKQNYYLIRAYFMVNSQNNTYMSVGVRVPAFNSSIQMNNSVSEAQNITIDY